jgi:hypothetical protein
MPDFEQNPFSIFTIGEPNMRLHQLVVACFVGFSIATTAPAQDVAFENDLIDDLPKERKEASRKDQPKREKKPRTQADRDGDADPPPADILPKIPGKSPPSSADRTTLIDDVNTVRRGEPNAAAKTANVIPDNLAEALARALRNGPTVSLAEAKVRQAQAELKEARLTATHDMMLAFRRWTNNKARLDKWKAALSGRALEKSPGGFPGQIDLQQAILEDECRIIYLLGAESEAGLHAETRIHDTTSNALLDDHDSRSPPTAATQSNRKPIAKPDGSLPEKMRTILETRVEFDFEAHPLSDVLEYLTACVEGKPGGPVQFISQYPLNEDFVTLRLKDITVAAGLQALADLHKYGFIFRDYGILVVETDDEMNSYRAAGTPMIAPAVGGKATAGSRDANAAGMMMPSGMPGMSSMSGRPPAASKKARAKK